MPFMKILSSAALYSVKLSLGCVWVQVYLVWSDKPWTIFWQKIQLLSNSRPTSVIDLSTYKFCRQQVQQFLSKIQSTSKRCPTKLNLDRHWTYASRVCPYPVQKKFVQQILRQELDIGIQNLSIACPTIFLSPRIPHFYWSTKCGQRLDIEQTLDIL